MKNIYKYTFTVFMLLVSGCSEVLDIETDGTISGDVLTNDDTIEKSLIGAYYSLGGITDGIDGGELLGGDFIVDQQGIIRMAYRSHDPTDRPTLKVILLALDEIETE